MWNLPGLAELNRWDTHRALAAFHVYVHLSLLATSAERSATTLEPTYGPIEARTPVMTSSRKALERAHYLGENVELFCQKELGFAGNRLVQWLSSALYWMPLRRREERLFISCSIVT